MSLFKVGDVVVRTRPAQIPDSDFGEIVNDSGSDPETLLPGVVEVSWSRSGTRDLTHERWLEPLPPR